MPKRIQLRRRKGWRMPPGAVKVDRTTRWGNPYKLEDYAIFEADGRTRVAKEEHEREARAMALRDFEHALRVGLLDFGVADVRRELAGKDLACWCPLPQPGEPDMCHAAILLEIANEEPLNDRSHAGVAGKGRAQMTTTGVWCVAWLDRDRKKHWCATFRNARPTAAAFRDKTACGMLVMWRVGSEKRNPTCPDCRRRLARRRKP